MPELSGASALTVVVACIAAGAIAFVVGVAVTILIRRLAARRNLRVGRRPIWRAPFTVLLVVLGIRGVLLAAGTQREWAGHAGHILGLAAIAIVGWLLTVVAVGLERALLARFPEAGLGDRRSRHVRTKIILVTRVVQALIVAVTVAAILWTIPPLRDIGAGILASAGLIGVIAGLAAQTTLGNPWRPSPPPSHHHAYACGTTPRSSCPAPTSRRRHSRTGLTRVPGSAAWWNSRSTATRL